MQFSIRSIQGQQSGIKKNSFAGCWAFMGLVHTGEVELHWSVKLLYLIAISGKGGGPLGRPIV